MFKIYRLISYCFRAKHTKKGQFTLKRKKSKAEVDFDDKICPLK